MSGPKNKILPCDQGYKKKTEFQEKNELISFVDVVVKLIIRVFVISCMAYVEHKRTNSMIQQYTNKITYRFHIKIM